jgi:hypothetical protein
MPQSGRRLRVEEMTGGLQQPWLQEERLTHRDPPPMLPRPRHGPPINGILKAVTEAVKPSGSVATEQD